MRAHWLALAAWAGACAHDAPLQRVAPEAAGTSGAAPARRFASPYTYEWFVRAELLRGRGQLAAAIAAYRSALAGADEDAYVLARLATALDQRGDHAAALSVLQDAARLEPAAEVVGLAEAEIAARAGDLARAFAALERAEQAEPLSPRAPLQLATLLRAHGAPERADAVLLRFEGRSLPGTAGAHTAQLSRALSSGDVARIWRATLPYRLNAPAPPEPLREAARRLLAAGRPAHALRLLELVPETPGEDGLRLRVLVACARYAAAEAWLSEHALASGEDQLAAASVYLALGRPAAAAESIEAAEECGQAGLCPAPDASLLQLMAAEIALAAGDHARAAELFAGVPSASPSHPAAISGLRAALVAAGLPDLANELSAQ
jgi:tetratricopeptide (TPR) repeat protein